MRRFTVIVGLTVVLVACGSRGTTTKVFKPANPVFPNFYLQLRGPSGAVTALAQSLGRNEVFHGFNVAPKPQGREDCNFSREIPRTASLRKYAGQKVTVWLFGSSGFAQLWCKSLRRGL